MILLGLINYENPKHWQGTKIHVKRGAIGGDVSIPEQFSKYLNERAKGMKKYDHDISQKQRQKIHEAYSKDLDHVTRSESFQAIEADVRFFGIEKAFSKARNDES